MWRTKGVKDVDSNWMIHWMKVKFDDQVTNFDALVKELSKAGFEVDGKPEYLEPEDSE
jgi:Txe/YoeB family toxin of Txe-Axe toxin-antitoxin module